MNQQSIPSRTEKSELLHREAIQALMAGQLDRGIALLEKAIARSPDAALIRNDLATAYWQSGQPAKAEAAYARALRSAPDNPYILNGYGTFLLEQYRWLEAERFLTRAYALKPDHYEIPNNLGLLYYRQGKLREAEDLFLKAIRLNPAWASAHANYARILFRAGRLEGAEEVYRHALTLNPSHATALSELGELRAALGDDDGALVLFRQAMAMDPSDSMTWTRLLDLFERRSDLNEVEKTLQQAKSISSSTPGLVIAEARLLRRQGKTAEAAAHVDKFVGIVKDAPVIPTTFNFFFEAGQVYDRAGEIDKAFECFTLANRAQAHLEPNSSEAIDCRHRMERIEKAFTSELAKPSCTLPAAEGPAPVFLVGFPRSGTTLLDQILSSHPDIGVAEEKPAIDAAMMHLIETYGEPYRAEIMAEAKRTGRDPWLLNNRCYPAALAALRTEDIAEMRRRFYNEHGKAAESPLRPVFIDKLPLNIHNAGFIKRIFPEARFILALRHPCDSVLSCYMQQFHLNPYMARFLDLRDAAAFYDETFRLWQRYTEIFDLDVHAVHYEDVVADFKPTIAALLKFLGVGWDDAVLQYDETAKKRGRQITTPSYHQVTEKIYTRASGRWLKYRKHMEPVLPILAPHALKHGYSMAPGAGQEQ